VKRPIAPCTKPTTMSKLIIHESFLLHFISKIVAWLEEAEDLVL